MPAAFVSVDRRTKQDGLDPPLLAARRGPEIQLHRLLDSGGHEVSSVWSRARTVPSADSRPNGPRGLGRGSRWGSFHFNPIV